MTFMDAVKSMFKKYIDFEGRATRRELWLGYLGALIINLLIWAIAYVTRMQWIIYLMILIIIPMISLGVRRLHDVNKSGWYILLVLIPIIGWIYLIYLFCQPGIRKGNTAATPTSNTSTKKKAK